MTAGRLHIAFASIFLVMVVASEDGLGVKIWTTILIAWGVGTTVLVPCLLGEEFKMPSGFKVEEGPRFSLGRIGPLICGLVMMVIAVYFSQGGSLL